MDWGGVGAAVISIVGSRAPEWGAALLLLARTPDPLTKPYALRSPARRLILEKVHASPGLTLSELRHETNLGWGTAYHHVNRLAAAGLVELVRAGRRRIILPAGYEGGEESARGIALLRGATARRIAQRIHDEPNTTIQAVCDATGDSRRAVYYHVKQLLEAGLIVSTSRTRHYGLRPSPLLLSALSASQESLEEPKNAADDRLA